MDNKIKKSLKAGKAFTIVIIMTFCFTGIVLLFMDAPLDRMQSFKMLVDAIFPYILPVLSGVSIGGIVKKIIEGVKK